MRKFRNDAKPISLTLASKLYWEGGTLAQVAKVFKIHDSNLMFRFRRFGIPIKTRGYALSQVDHYWQKGERNHGWKGGYSKDAAGYVVRNSDKKRLHRVVAEKALGRELKDNECVHHLDGNKENNQNSNLIICTNSYHSHIHAKMNGWKIGINFLPKRSQ